MRAISGKNPQMMSTTGIPRLAHPSNCQDPQSLDNHAMPIMRDRMAQILKQEKPMKPNRYNMGFFSHVLVLFSVVSMS